MARLPRIVGIVSIVVGVLAVIVGIAVYFEVKAQLSAQHITVASDAPFLAGKPVEGPLTAYSQALALNDHALEAGGGKTYAELDKSDPARSTVMTADFLQASLYTSVVAFGVSFLIAILGVMFVLVGLTFRELDHRTDGSSPPTGAARGTDTGTGTGTDTDTGNVTSSARADATGAAGAPTVSKSTTTRTEDPAPA